MIFRPFFLPTKILYLLGIWQDEKSSILYRLYGIVLFSYLLIQGSANQMIFVALKLESKEFVESFETLSILLTCFVTMFKALFFIWNLKKIQDLMKRLRNLLEFSNFKNSLTRPHVESHETSIIKLTNINYTIHFAICNLSVMIAIIFLKDRRLPFKTWFYLDYKKDFLSFLYLVLVEYLISIYTVLINGSFDFFPAIFMCYLIAILKELNDKIRKLRENSQDLKKCVRLHVKIKEFCEEFSKIYAMHFLIQGFFSALILCSSTFLLSKVMT